jgi:hypothetical protein
VPAVYCCHEMQEAINIFRYVISSNDPERHGGNPEQKVKDGWQSSRKELEKEKKKKKKRKCKVYRSKKAYI